MDATVCPQDIAYPTDLNLLDESRMMAESIIDKLHKLGDGGTKPRTYRKKARRDYLKVAQNRNPGRKAIRKGVKAQLQYLRRDLKIIEKQLDNFDGFPLKHKWQRYLWVIQTLYLQQKEMMDKKAHSVDHRIVSIHQPHVRPIVRGKARNRTEFGAKIHLSLVDGYSFLDTISWDAYNEGAHLQEYVGNYRARFGFYPAKVLADRLYCSRENRKWLKERNIRLAAKPLGRPPAKAVADHVRPGERNPIEGKFGQAKNGYGMNRIRPGSGRQANHGSPPSSWCSTWSNWPGRHCCARVFQHGKALKNRLCSFLKQWQVYLKFKTALTSKSDRFLMSFTAEFLSRP